jgi:TRAP-type C4-dicarboxylate transport system permease small subunit
VPVASIGRLYRGLLDGLAVIAGAIMGVIAVMIVYDVTIRNLGFQPPPHTLTLTEYCLLYVLMLGAPWLVRVKGHVYIELLSAAVPAAVGRWMARLVYLLCVVTCAIICWYAADATLVAFRRGDIDVRSFDMPRWALLAVMPLSFFLMAVEFARFLVGRDDMYTGVAGIHE